jgi:hypothetical protein
MLQVKLLKNRVISSLSKKFWRGVVVMRKTQPCGPSMTVY